MGRLGEVFDQLCDMARIPEWRSTYRPIPGMQIYAPLWNLLHDLRMPLWKVYTSGLCATNGAPGIQIARRHCKALYEGRPTQDEEKKTDTSPDLSVLHQQETKKLDTYHSDLSDRVLQERNTVTYNFAVVEQIQKYFCNQWYAISRVQYRKPFESVADFAQASICRLNKILGKATFFAYHRTSTMAPWFILPKYTPISAPGPHGVFIVDSFGMTGKNKSRMLTYVP